MLLDAYEYKSAIKGVELIVDAEKRGNIHLHTNGMIKVGKFFEWDGPSGFTIDTKNFMRGSLLHDAIYRLIRVGALPWSVKEYADGVLYRSCIEDGMSRFRARYVYKAVREFGHKSLWAK
jgi:hypothetical protein